MRAAKALLLVMGVGFVAVAGPAGASPGPFDALDPLCSACADAVESMAEAAVPGGGGIVASLADAVASQASVAGFATDYAQASGGRVLASAQGSLEDVGAVGGMAGELGNHYQGVARSILGQQVDLSGTTGDATDEASAVARACFGPQGDGAVHDVAEQTGLDLASEWAVASRVCGLLVG